MSVISLRGLASYTFREIIAGSERIEKKFGRDDRIKRTNEQEKV